MAQTALLDELARSIPPERLLRQPAQLVPYESDALTAFRLRPAAVLPIEMYTPERIAEFERETAVDEDTRRAVREASKRAKR